MQRVFGQRALIIGFCGDPNIEHLNNRTIQIMNFVLLGSYPVGSILTIFRPPFG